MRTTFGSDVLNDVVVQEEGVDRVHFKIMYNFTARVFELIVSGRIGCYLNDCYLSSYSPPLFLKNGDVIRIGLWEVVFNDE